MQKSHFRLLIVLVILVLFPLMSWYYLKMGMDYRLEAISELQTIGTFEWIETYNHSGRFLNEGVFENKFIVVGIVPENSRDLPVFSSRYTGLIEQFGKVDEVLYLNLVSTENPIVEIAFTELEKVGGVSVHRNHFIVEFPNEEIDRIIDKFTEESEESNGATSGKEFLYLVNPDGKVIQRYNFLEEDRVARLVEQLSMQLPSTSGRRDYSEAIRKNL